MGTVLRETAKSGENGGNYLEATPLPGGRARIRDTEAPEKAPFVVSAGVWDAFIDGAKKGEFDF